jgi:hypothetical protein
MGIYAEKKEGDFKLIEAGSYPARCYSMIEIGTVDEIINNETKTMKKVNITWELPTELSVFNEEKGEQPFSVSKMYTLSMHEKATLRKDLEGWRGKGFSEEEAKKFDITVLVGKPCMISIIHKPSKDGQRTYANISSISKLPKGMECPKQINPNRILSYQDFDWNTFNDLPEWIKDKMKSSKEYQFMSDPSNIQAKNEDLGDEPFPLKNDNPDDLPF